MKAIDYEEESTKRGNWLDITGGAAKDSLTVLDYFAGKAIEGICTAMLTKTRYNYDLLAADAYAMADAMLKERDKRFTPQNVVKGVTGKTYG